MKKKVLKASVLALALVMLITAIPLVQADTVTQDQGEIPAPSKQCDTVNHVVSLPDADRHEAIPNEIISAREHIVRRYDKETDLNVLTFGNQDGTETTYIFDEPVKYIDKDGNIADKSNQLFASDLSGYSFVNKENDVCIQFPTVLNNNTGIDLHYQDIAIIQYPYNGLQSLAHKETTRSQSEVVYYDVFGENVDLRYQPTFSGVKEEIVLYSNVGNKFQFILECKGLTPVSDNGGAIFIDDATGEVKAVLDPVFVYDSVSGKNITQVHSTWNNQIEIANIEDDQYLATITVDSSFLNSPNTVFPVYIDPSITLYSGGSGSGKTIIDLPIYNGLGVANVVSGGNSTAVLGYVGKMGDVQYGAGRLLMKFPGLMSKTFMKTQNYIINSATLYISETSGNSTPANISSYIYMGVPWSENSTYDYDIWSGAYSKGIMSTYCYAYPNARLGSFDITDAVRLWQSNAQYADGGIILRNTTSESNITYYKSLCMSESGSKPYLSVTYSTRTSEDNATLPFGAASRTFSIQLLGPTAANSTWYPLINASCNAWNNSNAGTNITASTGVSSSYTLRVAASPAKSWFGLTTPRYSGNTIVSAHIDINTSTIGASDEFRRSTITHEIGHLLFLDDNPNTEDYSLMKGNRDREIIYVPQQHDIYHVLWAYN